MKERHFELLRRGGLVVLVLAALVLSGIVLTRWAGSDDFDARLESAIARLQSPETEGDSDEKKPDKPKPQLADAAAQRIEKSYIFIPKPPQRFRSVEGVLGDRVLFAGGQSVGVGESFDGAKVIAIGSDWVDLEVDGKTISIGVFGGEGSRSRTSQ